MTQREAADRTIDCRGKKGKDKSIAIRHVDQRSRPAATKAYSRVAPFKRRVGSLTNRANYGLCYRSMCRLVDRRDPHGRSVGCGFNSGQDQSKRAVPIRYRATPHLRTAEKITCLPRPRRGLRNRNLPAPFCSARSSGSFIDPSAVEIAGCTCTGLSFAIFVGAVRKVGLEIEPWLDFWQTFSVYSIL